MKWRALHFWDGYGVRLGCMDGVRKALVLWMIPLNNFLNIHANSVSSALHI